MNILKLLILFSLIIISIDCLKHSPVVIQNLQVNIYRAGSGIYELKTNLLNFPINIDLMIYCFKQVNIINKGVSQCQLDQSQSLYMCIQTYYTSTNETLVIKQNWKIFTFLAQGIIQQIDNNQTQISIDTKSRKIIFQDNFIQSFKIYHMITALSRTDLLLFNINIKQYDAKIKVNYLQLYAHDLYVDTLIVQRYQYCHRKNNFIYLIFQGAVSRDNIDHFFTAILTINQANQKFHMWGGYSYSSSHAARDMVGYETYNSKFYDLFSLIAAAPFQDVAPNIKGNKNIVRVSNSANSSILDSPQITYHFIQFYRQFDTNDTKGDQIIRQKIYNRFCFVSYSEQYEPLKKYSFSVLNNSFIHDIIFCHQPYIKVSEINIDFKFSLFLIYLVLTFL